MNPVRVVADIILFLLSTKSPPTMYIKFFRSWYIGDRERSKERVNAKNSASFVDIHR